MSAETTMPVRGRESVLSTATRKIGMVGLSCVGHAESCTKKKGSVGLLPTAAHLSRQSVIMAACRHW